MKYLGMLIIAFGLIDLIGSYTGFDLWGGFIGIELPDLLWKYSSFIEMGLGGFIINLASKMENKETKDSKVSTEES
ncbi:hypothetical protein [Vibrio sp. AND4]|uniref:hypothetical protein n=1 Tax=Vibrio sp. AND4 TaxID=314289 RepID=UPI00015F2F5D|nr:hypothetical protein [Vibrio sp. AND4]EDP60802.1 hypothetical protein AND4_07779 [Vibrio sp. AND4]